MTEENLERYRQRYETWRHLDGLRYTTLQVVVAGFSALVAFLELTKTATPIWVLFAAGVYLFFQFWVLRKINDGIVANGKALHKYGQEVGDSMIPDVDNRKASIFYYIEWAILVAAIIFTTLACGKFLHGLTE